ncbi:MULTISPECIES: XRE family transcriptional regulator [Paenibacillus]|uniref:XRE family transcriptional regulator n=1 Tax=Paenibacillus vini TaxID=1476024 RepID=A0ABQ4MIT3_9BACL|nr:MULTISPECIES: XRE family transcriptional regulator [Paenibacillus]NWL87595.1 transcriptional regulator [Paenibacillus sp. 79R4]GIP55901.1 hypothetical protein J42TS3_49360 [Paenibacillus vini]
MNYADLLKQAIQEADLSLGQICRRLAKHGIKMDRAILSKMQNNKLPPAKDDVNIVLAEILQTDPDALRVAAVKEVVSPELIGLIKKVG